jgi:glycosyltransferase involved in cell wall biosynthesis
MAIQKPLVSIGVPVYNSQDVISRAIESLVTQD